MTIDYTSGLITGQLNPVKPQDFVFYAVTEFALYADISKLIIGLVCYTADSCDLDFAKEVLRFDWLAIQNQVKNLRRSLADMLFNSTDTRPLDTCQRGQPCPDQGFCEVSYRDWRNNKPSTFSSLCSNSTNQPMLHWSQILSVETTLDELTYTCNKPSCASRTLTDDIVQIIERQYILPVNVTIPPTTTTTQTSTTSLTSRTTTTVVTSATTTEEKSAATLVYMNYTKTIIFTFIFLIVACLFQFNYIN